MARFWREREIVQRHVLTGEREREERKEDCSEMKKPLINPQRPPVVLSSFPSLFSCLKISQKLCEIPSLVAFEKRKEDVGASYVSRLF